MATAEPSRIEPAQKIDSKPPAPGRQDETACDYERAEDAEITEGGNRVPLADVAGVCDPDQPRDPGGNERGEEEKDEPVLEWTRAALATDFIGVGDDAGPGNFGET
jgi:hypothetical protein